MAFSFSDLVLRFRKPPCVPGIPEDVLRDLFGSVEVTTESGPGASLVTSTGNIDVQFVFGSDGNFVGAFATVAGRSVPIIFGINSNALQLFKGSPSSNNPGPGWKVEIELTQQYFGGGPTESQWKLFVASRAAVINTF